MRAIRYACLSCLAWGTMVGSAVAGSSLTCTNPGEVNSSGKVCRADSGGGLVWGNKFRILYYGDSLAAESARYVRASVTAHGRATITDRSVPGTSPCDWTTAIKLDLSRGRPDAVMVETFGNNISRCQIRNGVRPAPKSAAYWTAYERDLLALVQRFPAGVPLWLYAAPAARNDLAGGYSQKARMLALMDRIAAGRPNTWSVDAGAAVESPAGAYTAYLPCLLDEACAGSPTAGSNRVRALDGLHFCPVIVSATIAQLRSCPVYASGAKRFGAAQAAPVVQMLGL